VTLLLSIWMMIAQFLTPSPRPAVSHHASNAIRSVQPADGNPTCAPSDPACSPN